MSSAPYFKLYFSDLAGDTLALSDAEIGSYILLIGAMWNAGGRLPNAPAKLARIARVSRSRWPSRWAALEDFFEIEGDDIVHQRVARERKKIDEISSSRSQAGVAGARAKALKSQETASANASKSDKQTGDIPDTIAKERENKSLSPAAVGDGDAGKKPPRRSPETTIPDGFPTPEMIQLGEKRVSEAGVVVNVENQARRFRTHALTSDRRCRNWIQAWRGWIDISIDGAPQAATTGSAAAPAWTGPAEIKAMFAKHPDSRMAAYLDRCTWRADPPAVLSTSGHFVDTLKGEFGPALRARGIEVIQIEREKA
jgi:uncharacterized protein YdaU (DUF1376 family)